MSDARGNSGGDGGILGSMVSALKEEANQSDDVEDGLREPLLGNGVDAEISKSPAAVVADAEDHDGKATIPPAAFLDLFFFADKVCSFSCQS